MSIHRFPVIALAAVALASLAACGDSDSTPVTDTPDAIGDVPADTATDNGPDNAMDTGTDESTENGGEVPPPAKARLRAIHLSPDAPAVDIFANGGTTAAVTGLAFPSGTGYLELDPGTYDFDIAPAGAGIGAKVLSVSDLALESGKSYTAVAFNTVASIQALALEDRFDGLAAGNIRIRAVHAAAGIGQVDIWALPEGGTPVPLIRDLDFAAASANLDVPAGAYTIGIDVDNDGTPELVFDLPALPAGTVATAYAVKKGDEVFLIAQLNDGTTARIDPRAAPAKARLRALHLSPDAPAVDIFANDGATAVVTGLAFPNGTGYLDLDAGEYNFDLSPAGAGIGSSVLDTGKLELESGKSYTAYAFDAVGSLKAGVLVDDYEGLAPGNIRVRAIHAAAGVGQVDIWVIPEMGSPTPLYTDVDFGAVGDALDVPAGAYTLGLDVDNDANPDLIFLTPALAAGTVANVFAVKKGDEVFLIAQLNDGTTARIDPVP